VRDGKTRPHRPRLVVSRSTCPPLSPSPHANSFRIGTAVINTHLVTLKINTRHPLCPVGDGGNSRHQSIMSLSDCCWLLEGSLSAPWYFYYRYLLLITKDVLLPEEPRLCIFFYFSFSPLHLRHLCASSSHSAEWV